MAMLRTGAVTAPKTLGAVLRHEVDPLYSRRTITLGAPTGADVDIEVGTVLGRRLLAAPVGAAVAGNTGTGTVGSVALSAGAKVGVYSLTALSATLFEVVDPAGVRLVEAEAGVAYAAGGIACTITAGGTAFVAGDGFTVTVAAGTGVWVPLVEGAADGTGTAHGVLARACRVLDGETVRATVLAGGPAAVAAAGLVWPDGIADAAITAATAELEAIGLRVLT